MQKFEKAKIAESSINKKELEESKHRNRSYFEREAAPKITCKGSD